MKKINFDAIVGLFVLAGFLAFVYMSLQLGEFSVFSMEKTYSVQATFNNISGLKRGATVEMSGVIVGKVNTITLGENDQAQVQLQINNGVKITEDAIASIKTQGIIGDKYIKISQGGSEELLADGGFITETESALDLEELVSKYIFGKV
ncbi:MAG: outer membrane lipid asymmetry maintenance protein MlaD [Desulfurivibrio sp.]|nr:outer membrane lipid asymmetry maintenance protein MlaD [Desulfurivibrio sp.]MBU4033588.1 outer membrane lipid asymmetry maintenance protein MlaD [Pseudomonadota bacterium]MBU4119067.1 outer membrane lipid asymmetry maintenance protein MlaD [Pseudomonadota bacterium]